jgi:hypothetical protein
VRELLIAIYTAVLVDMSVGRPSIFGTTLERLFCYVALYKEIREEKD